MKLFTSTALSVLALGALPAASLDFGNGFSLVGEIELEYRTDGDNSSSFGLADMTLGWRSQGGGQLGFGVDLAVVHFEPLEESDSIGALWGGLVLTTAFGEFTIGNPRPLIKTMLDTPEVGGIRIFDLELSSLSGSTLELAGLADNSDITGVSFKGGSGDLTYGVSYHQIEHSSTDVDAFEFAATYKLGNTLIMGGLEILDISSSSSEKVLLGATYIEDRWSAGVLFTSLSQGSSRGETIKLFGDYAVTDAFRVGAQALSLGGDFIDETFYGVSGEYGFGAGGYAQLGAFDADTSNSDTVYSASIGYRF